jgi:hypothetical protein
MFGIIAAVLIVVVAWVFRVSRIQGTVPHCSRRNTLPPDAQWNNQTFDFFDPTGAPKNYPVTDVLQTTWPLCDHVYEDTTNPLGPVAVPRRMGSLPLERLAIKAMRKAQMIGASTEPSVTLGSDVASVSFRLYPPAAIAQVGTRARETFFIYGHRENLSRLS